MNRVVECGMKAARVAIVLFVPSLAAAQANGHLQVHYLNVGQGDASLIISPLGQTLLIDSGPSSASNCASATGIISQLTAIGVTRLDYHVASHYDADHIGCSDAVVGHWPVQHAVYDRGTTSVPSTQTYARYAAAVANKRQTVTVGQQIVLDSGAAVPVIFQVVAVNGNGTAGSLSENDRSIVLVLHFGSFDAEFGGDLAGENSNGNHNVESLIASAVGQVEAYKVHHHGSATSSNAAWMSAIHPKVAILSVGSPNAFNHPTQAALDRIHASGAVTYWTTAGDGAPAVSAFDVVANGTIAVDVPTAGTTFTVSHGGVFEAFPSWGTACVYAIAPTSATVPAAGGSGRVTVTTGGGCWWSAWSIDSAITVTSSGFGSDGGTVDYTVAANTSTTSRTGTITIAGSTFTITQAGAPPPPPCSYSITPTSTTVAPAGGTGIISVTAPSGCTWTAASDAIYATITSGASGSGSGTVSYSVAISTGARSATFTIAGHSFQVTQGAPSETAAAALPDFDGDGKGEIAVFRPSTGTWFVRYSSQGYNAATAAAFQWGLPGDMPISGDFDGDGKIDLTVFRPSNGTWYVRYSSLNYDAARADAFQWGLPGDTPIAGDLDGDGKTELTVFRPSTGTWYVRYSAQAYNPATADALQWGLPEDVPVAGDFDGDGKVELAVFRPSNGTWYVRYSALGYSIAGYDAFQWGLPGDIPIVGDLDGDGKAELTVFRPSNGTWYVRYSALGYNIPASGAFQWGLPGDIPIVGDLDGDTKAELTVFRPLNGLWYVRYSSLAYSNASPGVYQWGLPGDMPIKR